MQKSLKTPKDKNSPTKNKKGKGQGNKKEKKKKKKNEAKKNKKKTSARWLANGKCSASVNTPNRGTQHLITV